MSEDHKKLLQAQLWKITNTLRGKMHISLPFLPEQTKIAHLLTAFDRKSERVATQITEPQTFKKGLLQQMFV